MTEPRPGAIARVVVTLDPKDADFLKRQAARMLRRAVEGGATWQRWAAVLDALGAAELAPPRPRLPIVPPAIARLVRAGSKLVSDLEVEAVRQEDGEA